MQKPSSVGAVLVFLLSLLVALPSYAAEATLLRGEYLTRVAGCASCHTAPGGAPFAGGFAMKLPRGMGTLFTPNITPDKKTGIGAWSDADFLRAMRQGIAKNGEHLYPAFPYTSFALMRRSDILAIKAYIFSLPAVHNVPPRNHISFPYDVREGMVAWNWLFLPGHHFAPNPRRSVAWNRGAYLAEAVAHCSECHTPRSSFTEARRMSEPLAGGVSDGWSAYNITSDRVSGLGAWSDKEIASYLSTGVARGKAWATGPMALEVADSTRYLTRSDLADVITYLRTIPPVRDAKRTPRFAVADLPRKASPAALDQMPGATVYGLYCASCHGASARPATDIYPSMAHESAVGAEAPNNLVLTILEGAQGRVGRYATMMPSFARKFDNQQIADLVNYLYAQFGNPTKSVTADQIKRIRRSVP